MTIKSLRSDLPQSLLHPNRARWCVNSSALITAMELRGISSVTLAREANVSCSLIRNLRNGGHTGTTYGTLARLCYVLTVTPDIIATPVEVAA